MQQQLTRDGATASIEDEPATEAADARLPVFPYGEGEVQSASFAPGASGVEACPDCGGDTLNAQGALDCRECDWLGIL